MLFILYDYLNKIGKKKLLVAATVDHGLRSDSVEDVKLVSKICYKYNIIHEKVFWNELKPYSGIYSKGRIVRYNLLCQIANKYKSKIIVTGHTLNDQIETYIMRLKRLSSIGLATMSRLSILKNNIFLLRPLLNIKRSILRIYLKNINIVWKDDPTNENSLYERSIIRKNINENNFFYFHKIIVKKGIKRKKEGIIIEKISKRNCLKLMGEVIYFKLDPIYKNEKLALIRLVAILSAIMGGKIYPNNNQKELKNFLEENKNFSTTRMTLSRSIIEKTKKYLYIWRENRNIPSIIVQPNTTIIWDGRYKIFNRSDKEIMVRSPNDIELKNIMKQIYFFYDKKYYHIPSIKTSCLIISEKNLSMPAFMSIFNNKDIKVTRIMLPFYEIISGYDFNIFNILQRVFMKY